MNLFNLGGIKKVLDEATKEYLFEHGGPHLGVMRRWIQQNFSYGYSIEWGSAEGMHLGRDLTPRELSQLAHEIAVATLEDFAKRVLHLLATMFGDMVATKQEPEDSTWVEHGKSPLVWAAPPSTTKPPRFSI
jgi:hypothetical protein